MLKTKKKGSKPKMQRTCIVLDAGRFLNRTGAEIVYYVHKILLLQKLKKNECAQLCMNLPAEDLCNRKCKGLV